MAEYELEWDEVKIGDEITVWQPNGCGQGGKVTKIGVMAVEIEAPYDSFTYMRDNVSYLSGDRPLPADQCLDYDPETCQGPVEYRYSGNRNWPRCEHHGEERLRRHEEQQERYPYHQPSDFDPTFAGERWDDDY